MKIKVMRKADITNFILPSFYDTIRGPDAVVCHGLGVVQSAGSLPMRFK